MIYDGVEMSYDQLARRAQALVVLFAEHGVEAGGVAAVLSTSSFTLSLILCAALHMGVTIFPIDPLMGSKRRNRLLSDSGCSLVIADVELDGLPGGVKQISVDSSAATDMVLEPSGARGDVQLIVTTSGSEGDPKGVMLSGANIAASVAASRDRLGLNSDDLWLNCLPMYHIGGIMILYRCLDAGAGMLLHSGFDAQGVWLDLQRHKVTHISLVPAMLARLLDVAEDSPPPDSLRVALIGGGHLSPELATRAHKAGWSLCVSYGMSESCSQCATDCSEQAGLVSGSVGLPLDSFEIALSEQGRVLLRGPAVMLGYVNPDRSPGQGLLQGGWFEAGDLGEIDASGRLLVLGRADDVLISGGRNIHPIEIENLVVDCPGVDEVAVVACPDQTWGDLLVAIYAGGASQEEVVAWCRANIVSPLRPREFIQVKELPRNHMGKLERKSLKAMAGQT